MPESADAADPVALADSVDDPLIADANPIENDDANVLDEVIDDDRGNVGLAVSVLDPDVADVRTNEIALVTVDAEESADEYEKAKLADKVLLAVKLALPTKTGDAVKVLLVDIDEARTKVGEALDVAEPLRLAAPFVVVEGAASLAAIKANVI